MKTAVCHFSYNRPEKTLQSLEALAGCDGIEDCPMVIIQDNCRKGGSNEKSMQVRAVIRRFIEAHPALDTEYLLFKENAGPYLTLKNGFSYALRKYGCAVRIEDDVVVRPDYLNYMRSALEYYRDDEEIFCINSFNPSFKYKNDTFLSRCFRAWGMGTWKEKFETVVRGNMSAMECSLDGEVLLNLYGDNKRFAVSALIKSKSLSVDEDGEMGFHIAAANKWCVSSSISYCTNIGWDESGTSKRIYKSINENFALDHGGNGYEFSHDKLTKEEEIKFSESLVRFYKEI